jgi:hypothetical protein
VGSDPDREVRDLQFTAMESRLGVLEDRMSSMLSVVVRTAKRLDGGSS